MSTNITIERREGESYEDYLDRLNDALLAEARKADRLVQPTYLRAQDVPGSEAWEVAA